MKKFLALFLALVLVLGLVACGGKKDEGNKAGDGETIELTIGLEPSMYVTSYTENTFTKWIEEQCNVKLKFVEYAGGTDVATQISTTISARLPLPDLLIGITLDDVTRQRYGEEGYFVDMQEYFDDKEGASKTFWTRLGELSEQDQQNTITQIQNPETGAIYAVPMMETSLYDSMYYQTWINTEWLDKVGLDKPTSNDELLKVLRAFQANDCNGNGDKNDEIPLMASVNGNLGCFVIDWLLNTFVYYNQAAPYLVGDDGKLTHVATTEEYREGLKFIRQLYKEGLLSPLTFTSSSAELKSMFTPADGVAKGGIVVGHLTLHTSDSSAVLDQYEPLQTWGYAVRRATTCKLQNMISADCENPEKAFEVMMCLWSKESSLRQRYGLKGDAWDEPDEGAKSLLGLDAEYKVYKMPQNEQHANNWGLNQCTLVTNAEYETAQLTAELSAGAERRLKMHAESSRLYDEAAKKNPEVVCPALVFTPTEKEETQMERINVPNRISKYRNDFILGTEDINSDATWNKYMKLLEDDGLDAIMKQNQMAYDRQTGK